MFAEMPRWWRVESQLLNGRLPQGENFVKGWPTYVYGEDRWGHLVAVEAIANMNAKLLTQIMSESEITLHRVQVIASPCIG